MPQFLRRPLFWGVLAGLVLAWTLLGFLAVPRLVASLARDQVRNDYGRELGIGEVRFNPWLLALEVRGIALPDADGGPLLTLDRLFLDLQVDSVWRRALSFRAVAVDGLVVHATLRPGGDLNLADLANPALPPGEPPPPAEPLPAVEVADLSVQGARIVFADRDRADPYTTELAPLTFRVRDLSTHITGGDQYELDVTAFGDARIRWRGTFELEPLASAGELELAGIPLPEVDRFLGDALPLQLAAGTASFRARYDLADAPEGLRFVADEGGAEVRGLALRERGGAVDLVKVPAIDIAGLRADLARSTVDIGSVNAADGVVTAWLEPDGSVNLVALAGPSAPAADPAAPEPASAVADGAAPPAADGDAWTVRAPALAVRNFTVTVEDRSLEPAARVTLAPVDVAVAGFTTAPDAAVQVTLSTGINGKGTLQAKADTRLDTLATEATLELAGLALEDLQPWVARAANLDVRQGRLDVTGKLTYGPADAGDAVGFRGDVTVAGLRAIDTLLGEDFVKWSKLRLRGVEYDSLPAPGRLRIREVAAASPYVRLIIGPDGTTNLDTVLAAPGAASAVPAEASAGADAPAPDKPAEPSLAAQVDVVRIRDGSTDFADLSIRPPFATGIQKLKGTVRGLSSDPKARATVELDGQVDQFSPVKIRGEVNPLAAETSLDISMSFRNFELASFTPYAGRFAGYSIRQGKLNLDLNYVVEGQQLKADHHIVIDQLELGDKVDSPDAVSLPLKLAVALLKDRNGVIDLELPVSGSLDDPQFRLAPIIWKVFVNLITKAVTAPFALLGSLFGGGDDVNLIAFAPGEASLGGDGQSRIDALVKALTERPGLELTVPAVFSRDADGPALVESRLAALVVDAKRRELAARKADPATAGFDAIAADRDDYLKQLTAAWRETAGPKAPLPPLPPAPAGDVADPDDPEPRIAVLEAALRARIEVGDAELFDLARRRAVLVEERLLTGTGIAPERVFLVAPTAVEAGDGAVVLELALR
ncbi:MAG: DUF748 domain-containing protein [Chromatiales bacterium]|nr:DUF748 domain-containing protein [Chromatiales bacterium]